MSGQAVISWDENEQPHRARWRSESGMPPPKRVLIADDRMTADAAFRLASEGTALLWRGDFQNARQLLQAMARRIDRKPQRVRKPAMQAVLPADAFNLHRQAQSQRGRTLAMLLVPLDGDYRIALRRAPDVRLACIEAYGPANEAAAASPSEDSVVSLREVLGLIGAYEWRKKGVEIPALNDCIDNRIHPHYGVFSPVRGEYVTLVAEAPLPRVARAFDIGTGTGVLAAVLAQRGIARVVGTDQDPRALACARENMTRLGLHAQVEVLQADLFPQGRAGLIVCNPPWIPARPSSPIEHAIYDPESRMLRGFLGGLAVHLEPDGEGWLILSDLAEHLALRSRAQLLEWIAAAGLTVLDRIDVRPHHPRATDAADPLHAARAAEVTSLWRLAVA